MPSLSFSSHASNFVDFIQCFKNLLRPKRQSSGLEMEANLSFEDEYLHSQRTDINKQCIQYKDISLLCKCSFRFILILFRFIFYMLNGHRVATYFRSPCGIVFVIFCSSCVIM